MSLSYTLWNLNHTGVSQSCGHIYYKRLHLKLTQHSICVTTMHSSYTKADMGRAVRRQLAELTFGDLLWLRWAVIIADTRQWLHTGTSLALDTTGHHLKANYLHSSNQQ